MSFPEGYPYSYPSPLHMPQPQHLPPGAYNPNMVVFPGYPQYYLKASPPMGVPRDVYQNPFTSPPKEMEFVLQKFPEPTGEQAAPKEPHKPKHYIFQNAGPHDF